LGELHACHHDRESYEGTQPKPSTAPKPQPARRNIHIVQAKNNTYTLAVISRGTVMLRNELHTKKAEIEAAAAKYGATQIRIFGSVARGNESPDSDIDFLVDLPQGYDLFLQRLPLTEDLAKLTGRKVDLVPEHELNIHMRDYVLQEAAEI